MLKITVLSIVAAVLLFSACAGTASRNDSAGEAESAAMDALAGLDGGGSRRASGAQAENPQDDLSSTRNRAAEAAGGGTSGGAAQTAEQTASFAPVIRPPWVDSPDMVYPRARYLSAVGSGGDRNRAERDALAKLTGLFGQSVEADLKTISSYTEAVKNGAVEVNENTSAEDAINIAAEMDTLVGAEIAGVWFDSRQTWYAVAVMEKEKTSVLYADLIRSNERSIEDLVTMTPALKNSLDGYSRYFLAGTIADANRVYANVLTVVGDTRGIDPAAMKKGDDYRIEAASVARNIPIGVAVEGDRADRIKTAFSKAISAAGFRSGGNNSRYTLRASYTVTEEVFPNERNKFVRYRVQGGLEDSADGGSVLVPYTLADRWGHLDLPKAEEAALRDAEKKIAAEFETAFRAYITSLAY